VNPGRGLSPSFQQNFEPKEWVKGLGPRAGQEAKISKTCLLCDVTSRNPPTENENVFFPFWLQDLLNPWMVWIAL